VLTHLFNAPAGRGSARSRLKVDGEAMQREAKPAVVVIGAGVLGLLAAVESTRRGAQVTVLDALGPGGGTTTAGAGFVGAWDAGFLDHGSGALDMQRYGIDFYRELQGRRDLGFRNRGTVALALTGDEFERYSASILSHPRAGPGTRALSAADVAAVMPVVDPSKVTGGVFIPEGAQLETHRLVAALVAEAEAGGVSIRTGRLAVDVRREGGAVSGVVLADGDVIAADRVIVAAGAWSGRLLDRLGLDVPLRPMVATRVTTASLGLSDRLPTVMAPGFVWLRESNGALTFGSGYDAADDVDLQTPGRPSGEHLARRTLEELDGLREVFPPLRYARIESVIHGLPVFTPDLRFVVGPVPDLPGVVVLAGDNESGVLHGPGLARAASDLLLVGTTRFDIEDHRADRFAVATQASA
jgi:glycine/D-amino acid oxidase-like deaminating enzyme